ncbi:MAG: cysteine dioxygenase family protein [Acidobacteriota bacterium]|jgi:predicted metal-dependent enzyme (double-stranded beta helix superfamily)
MHEIRRVPIDEFVERLRAIPAERFMRERVLQEMSSLLLERDSLERYCHFIPERYTRNKVFRNDLFEVILLCWGVGHRTPIHNHDNQHGWMSVQRGMLTLQNYRRVACGMGGPGDDPRRCKAGSQAPVLLEETSHIDIASVGAICTVDRQETIHEIANLEAFGEPAISLHVYSHPIDSCVVYDLANRSCERVQLSYYSEGGRVVAPA